MAVAHSWGSSQGNNHIGARSGVGSNSQPGAELRDSAGSRLLNPLVMGDEEDGGDGAHRRFRLQLWNGCFAGKQAFAQWRDVWHTLERNPKRQSVRRKQQV